MSNIKEKFEEWAKNEGYLINLKDREGYYEDPIIKALYGGYKAGVESQQSEIDKLQKALEEKKDVLEKISQIDWSHTKESDAVKLLNCIEWAEQSCKEIKK